MSRINKLAKKLEAAGEWLWLRKKTTPVHWAYGFFCDFLIYAFGILAGWGMMGAFGLFEAWNDHCEGTKGGFRDWWEAFLMFCIGKGILALLHCLGIISIGWY